jgi:hypothetical protein
VPGQVDLHVRAVEKHINAIFAKLGLAEEVEIHKRSRPCWSTSPPTTLPDQGCRHALKTPAATLVGAPRNGDSRVMTTVHRSRLLRRLLDWWTAVRAVELDPSTPRLTGYPGRIHDEHAHHPTVPVRHPPGPDR